jgi:hypothetical protein
VRRLAFGAWTAAQDDTGQLAEQPEDRASLSEIAKRKSCAGRVQTPNGAG